MLGIKEYPTPNVVGMYNRLLAAPFEFVLTQSFTFLSKGASEGLLQRQLHRMVTRAISASHSQRVASGFGCAEQQRIRLRRSSLHAADHRAVARFEPAHPQGQRLKPLNDSIALARSLLADTGMTVAREDLALEAAFWAQLPGNFALRPRKAPITSRNFAAMAPSTTIPAVAPPTITGAMRWRCS